MNPLRIIALAAVLGTAVAPAMLTLTTTVAMAESAPPTKEQMETAVKAANPTIGQLKKLKKLDMNSMTPAQLQQSLGQIFSPAQLATIQKSLAAQGVSMPGQ